MMLWNARHYRLVAASRVFQSREYARHYLQESRWKRAPLLHYLLIGEQQGYFPNALFDPAFMRDRHDCAGLGDYLRHERFWPYATCDLFDGRYYAPAASVQDLDRMSPLEHFWAHGLDKNLNPSEAFDTRFFKAATTRDCPDKRGMLFRILATRSNPPFSQQELTRRQETFAATVSLRLVSDTRGSDRRKNLVWVQCNAQYDTVFLRSGRSFDVLLNYYEDPGTQNAERPCDIALFQKGTKTTAVAKVLNEMPHLLEPYDYVLMLDDDVDMSAEDIEILFRTMAAEDLDLAQPSLTLDSQTWFQDLKQPTVGRATRPVSAVEIMAPCLSRKALQRCGWAFSKSISGWGTDLLLGALVSRELGSQPAVIGACQAEHLRELDTEHGTFYKFLMSHGIDANVEAGAIGLAYDVDIDPHKAIRLL